MNMKHNILSGSEPFFSDDIVITKTVKDFWAWAMSRLIADGPRGDLAEFIVNTALGIDLAEPKRGWGECDILYPYHEKTFRIEVKCSTVLQAWERKTPSTPTFSISKTLSCDIEDDGIGYRYIGRDDSPPQRRSELYVFCLFNEQDREKAYPLNLDQWLFYIVPTNLINEKLGDRKSISLAGLHRLGIVPVPFHSIKSTVDAIVSDL